MFIVEYNIWFAMNWYYIHWVISVIENYSCLKLYELLKRVTENFNDLLICE